MNGIATLPSAPPKKPSSSYIRSPKNFEDPMKDHGVGYLPLEKGGQEGYFVWINLPCPLFFKEGDPATKG
jgi:hypothetical protein